MKKSISILAATMFFISSAAQTINIHFKNGQKVQFTEENVDHVDFSPKPDDPTLTPGELVDLGLSVKWASCNLGASTPTEFGGYYAWGETSTKDKYTEDTYTYYDKSTNRYTDIGSEIGGTSYDAATVNLGKGWRIPSVGHLKELMMCKHEWTQVDGVNGYLFTGPNGNTLFLPAAGYSSYTDIGFDSGKDLFYMSSTKQNDKFIYILEEDLNYSRYLDVSIWLVDYGHTIRPIYYEPIENPIENIESYVTCAQTGISTIVSSEGTYYTKTIKITNSSSADIQLISLCNADIRQTLAANSSTEITVQSKDSYPYPNELLFIYNGNSYIIGW